jgi:hypothetical protein
MEQDQKPKEARQRKALPQQSAAKDKAEVTPASAPAARDPMRIYENARGELAISPAGLRKIATTFLGSNAHSDPNLKGCIDLENARLGQAAAALPYAKGKCGTPEALNIAMDAVASLAPRDGMEVMLCSQLVALHSQGMDFLRRGMLPEQTYDAVDRNVNRATKLLRTFATMAECLRTHRGGGQQKVTVEHVTVQPGGQAIVGTVNRGVGGGDAQQNGE